MLENTLSSERLCSIPPIFEQIIRNSNIQVWPEMTHYVKSWQISQNFSKIVQFHKNLCQAWNIPNSAKFCGKPKGFNWDRLLWKQKMLCDLFLVLLLLIHTQNSNFFRIPLKSRLMSYYCIIFSKGEILNLRVSQIRMLSVTCIPENNQWHEVPNN